MDIKEVLKSFFGYEDFKKGQKQLIEGVLCGNDVVGIMPTSGGKSICYQIPALMLEGVTLVISPLISLMKDQVDALIEYGVSAAYLNSTLSQGEYKNRLQNLKDGVYKLVYIAPEGLNSQDFINAVSFCTIQFIAIDEAHCISQWGHDFRPDYKIIPEFISKLPKRPIIGAYTATATTEIKEDIISTLKLKEALETVTGFDRPNLYFAVEKPGNKNDYIMNYLNKHIGDPGIIYCATRKETENLTQILDKRGFKVSMYHGGMANHQRQQSQEEFIYDKAEIMVATNAFGMGIDKSNVRFVIHYNMPKNMEAYYQEAGRAGRDGEESDCILLYAPQDVVKQKYLIEVNQMNPERERIAYKNLQSIVDYCNTNDCLRVRLMEYFGDNGLNEKCNKCGNCLDDSNLVEITTEAQKIMSCIARMKERFGTSMVAGVLSGSKDKRIIQLGFHELSTYGIMKGTTIKRIREIIQFLIAKGFINITEDKYPVVQLNSQSYEILKGKRKVFKPGYNIQDGNNTQKQVINGLFQQLKTLRRKLAEEKNIPPYIIFSDASLREMALHLPQNIPEFLDIKGVGQAKMETYGHEFLQLINNYTEKEKPVTSNTFKEKDNKQKSHRITCELFEKGLSVQEIAIDRNLTESTIVTHLERCIHEGEFLDFSGIIDENIEIKVLNAMKQCDSHYLSKIKEMLTEDISYLDIKKVLLKCSLMQNNYDNEE